MRTRKNALTSVRRARTRGANNSIVWSRPKTAFASICPRCGRERLQHGYTRRTLLLLLNTRRKIDAYCIVCNVCWPVNESELHMISPP
jgi:hypothetical protein